MSEPAREVDPETLLTDAERAEMDASSAPTPDDLARAAQGWRTAAGRELRDLLDAPPTEDA